MLTVQKLCGALGAEVLGVDLSRSLDDDTGRVIVDAFHEHIVLVFHDQSLTAEAQIAFTERFGAVEPHPLKTRASVEGHPEVLTLQNRPGRPGARNDYWHSDISHAERPPAASFLYALEVPQGRGDTLYCNMYAAYERLSPTMRGLLKELTALHSGEATMRRNNEERNDALPIDAVPPPVAHPVVRTHPGTGRKALFVNPHFTVRFSDMTLEESRPLLEFLSREATRPENVYRHRWRAGDLVMWDNRCAMHYGVLDYDENMPRRMHRTTAAGEQPH